METTNRKSPLLLFTFCSNNFGRKQVFDTGAVQYTLGSTWLQNYNSKSFVFNLTDLKFNSSLIFMRFSSKRLLYTVSQQLLGIAEMHYFIPTLAPCSIKPEGRDLAPPKKGRSLQVNQQHVIMTYRMSQGIFTSRCLCSLLSDFSRYCRAK